MIDKTHIILDTNRPAPVVVYAKQNSVGTRYIEAELQSSGEYVDTTNITSLMLAVLKPDGTRAAYSDGISTSGYHTVSIPIKPPVLEAAGKATAELTIGYGDGTAVTTFAFNIIIEDSVLPDDVFSSNYFTEFVDGLSSFREDVYQNTAVLRGIVNAINPVVLYESHNGTNERVPLSAASSTFDWIQIIYKDNDGNRGSTVGTPGNKIACQIIQPRYADGAAYVHIKTSVLEPEVFPPGLTLVPSEYAEVDNVGGTPVATHVNNIYVTKVIGFNTAEDAEEYPVEPYILPVATSTELGGIKADPAGTGYTQPAKIGADGKLYVPAGGGGGGISPTITVTDITGGHQLTITDVDGTETVDILDGANGQNGYTPVKGTDYFTAADKAEIVQDVIDELPIYNGGVE